MKKNFDKFKLFLIRINDWINFVIFIYNFFLLYVIRGEYIEFYE